MSSQYRKFLQQCMEQFRISFGTCIASPSNEMETSPDECAEINQVHVAAEDGSDLRSQPAIFRLNPDCLRELFELLSLEDLLAFGKTCKWLCHNVGQWLHEKRPHLQGIGQKNSIMVSVWPPHWFTEIDCFSQFISNVRICHPLSENGCYLRLNRYQYLKSITFDRIKIVPVEIEGLREILGQVETIKFYECKIDGNTFEALLSACENMRYLSVNGKSEKKTSKIIGTSNGWLRKKYPKLEHFELNYNSFKVQKTKELPQFFYLNSNIRSFSTDAYCVLKHSDYFLETKTKFDIFSITIASIDEDYPRKCIQLLNQLYKNKLYEQLHLDYGRVVLRREDIDSLVTLKALIKVKIKFLCSEGFFIPVFPKLEEVYFTWAFSVNNWVELPDHLVNLHRIGCEYASADEIFMFIGRSPKLTTITVRTLFGGIHFNGDTRVLDLVALNDERKKLKGAQKTIIYLIEEIYLATKWALTETNFSLVQLKSSFYMPDKDFPESNF